MDELAREYYETHDPEIPEQIFELASRLRGWTIEGPGFGLTLRRQGFVSVINTLIPLSPF
jgi:hypothetical protein